jgi:hypothetical protein
VIKSFQDTANWSTKWSGITSHPVSVGGFRQGTFTDPNVIWGK